VTTSTEKITKTSNSIESKNERSLWFNYQDEDEVCQVILLPDTSSHLTSFTLQPSGDYDIIDSIRYYNHQYLSTPNKLYL
jgi:hypothetical protein